MSKTETLPGGLHVFTTENYPITTDSLLLARFAIKNPQSGELKPGWTVCDLGSGNGILLLSLVDTGMYGRAVGVELSEEGTGLLRSSMDVDELINVESIQADLRSFNSSLPFDVVLCNPPYFNNGALPQDQNRAAARHEVSATLEDICAAANRLLKDGGRFYLCFPPRRLPSLFATLTANNLAPRVLRLVRNTPQQEPWLALIDARKAGGEALYVLPDQILNPPK